MKQNIKRPIYLIAFTFLGFLLGLLIEAIVEFYYTTLLLADFNRYSFGLSWADLTQIRDFFAVLVFLASAWWGYRAGIYWWHQIYELNKYGSKQWFKRDYTKKLGLVYVIAIIAAILFVYVSSNSELTGNNPANISTTMKITSTSFTEGGNIPEKYTCKNPNPVNPELKFSGVPLETKSLALVLHDPDAPVAGGFTHWVVYDMPPQTRMIAENSAPAGMQAKNGAGTNKYIGPCPPSGTHRYFFKLYALDTVLAANSIQNEDNLITAMQGHILSEAELMAKFSH